MICRKCGAQLPDNVLRCTKCGIKVNMHCPKCGELNRFGSKTCSACGFELIKTCPVCGSHNIYSAAECRKCHTVFDLEPKEAVEEPQLKQVTAEKPNETDTIVRPFTSEKNVYNDIMPNFAPAAGEISNIDDIFDEIQSSEIEPIPSEIEQIPEENEIKSEEIEDKEEEKIFTIEDIFKETEEEQTKEDSETEFAVAEAADILEADESVPLTEPVSETEKEETEDYEEPKPINKEASEKAVQTITKSLTKHVIAINGTEGTGKTALLNDICNVISTEGYIPLHGSCSPLVQITSFGFFQDAFLRLLGFPTYTSSTSSFINDFKKSNIAKIFSSLSGGELSLFLNIFYPTEKDVFENILENKKRMFSILEKVIKSFLMNSNLVIAIDNFELLDGASYDFLVHLMKKGFFNSRLKLLVAYQENKSIESYFDSEDIDENIFETILIKKFSKENLYEIIKRNTGLEIEKLVESSLLEELLRKAGGNAVRLEQEIALLCDTGYINTKDDTMTIDERLRPELSPATFSELIELRLNSLAPAARNILYTAAISGYRFSKSILANAVPLGAEKTAEMLDFLAQEMFIQPVDKYTYEFRSLTLWKIIYKEAKSDLLYKENEQRLYEALKPLILSCNVQKLICCAEAISKRDEFEIWQNTRSIAAKLGDTNLYIIACKQCLKITDEENIEDSEQIKAKIYEETGKLLWKKSPQEAITYLSNVLDAEIKASNVRKVIDLSGYFIKSCYLTGNYFGVAEAVDSIITLLRSTDSKVSELEIALIKTRKLNALFNIGNSEQIINTVNEEIIPELNKTINIETLPPNETKINIESWLLAKTVLAKAYAIQGNSSVFKEIELLHAFIRDHNCDKEYYTGVVSIIEALANTACGEINKSNEILNTLAAKYSTKVMNAELLAEWNFINIINRVFSGSKKDLKVDLFEMAAFTNNINSHFIKNTVKLILGYILQEEGSEKKAMEIFNEEITYFAKEKVALGALLSWALIVRITMAAGDDEKALNTAVRSLEIAQSPKINNNFFIIYFQKFLAEIYIRKGDFIAAKMYLEKSIMLAKQQNLKYQLTELYMAYGSYLESLMKSKGIYSEESVKLTSEFYDKAYGCAKELRLQNLTEKAQRERSAFKTFCQLNEIEA